MTWSPTGVDVILISIYWDFLNQEFSNLYLFLLCWWIPWLSVTGGMFLGVRWQLLLAFACLDKISLNLAERLFRLTEIVLKIRLEDNFPLRSLRENVNSHFKIFKTFKIFLPCFNNIIFSRTRAIFFPIIFLQLQENFLQK